MRFGGRSVLFTTQLLPMAEFADRVCAVLHQGAVRAFDRIDRLRSQPVAGAATAALEQLFTQLHEEPP